VALRVIKDTRLLSLSLVHQRRNNGFAMQAALNSTLGAREYFSPQRSVCFCRERKFYLLHSNQLFRLCFFSPRSGVALFCEKGRVIEKVAPANKDGLAKTRASLGF
jgi:hypothetical protein